MSRDKRKRLSWTQEAVVRELQKAPGKWQRVPVVASGSAIRGLIARGIIEHKPHNPNDAWEWIRIG